MSQLQSFSESREMDTYLSLNRCSATYVDLVLFPLNSELPLPQDNAK